MHWLQGTKTSTALWLGVCAWLCNHTLHNLCLCCMKSLAREAVSSSQARDALILLILSNYFETAYFWQSRLRCLNIERAAAGAGSGLLGDAFISQHLSIIQPPPRSIAASQSASCIQRCDLMIQCNQTLYQWQPPATSSMEAVVWGSNFVQNYSLLSFLLNKEFCMYCMLYCITLPDLK